MAKILSICGDDRLRYTRQILLCRTGAEVVSSSADSCLELIRKERFDLLVMGYSIPADVAKQACQIFRHISPEGKILYVSFPLHVDRSSIIADRIIDWTEGPDAFQSAVQDLILMVEQQTPLHPGQKPNPLFHSRNISDLG